MENTIQLADETILLFLYGKAIDLWIAEQGTDCLETNHAAIPKIAESLWEDFWHTHKQVTS
jgi:hypothetical protein